MTVLIRLVISASLACLVVGCGSGNSSTNTGIGTGPGSPVNATCTATLAGAAGGAIGTGFMTARIDGGLWNATCMAVLVGAGTLTVTGIDSLTSPTAQIITMSSSNAVGVYQISADSALNALITTPFAASVSRWQAGLATGTGQLSLSMATAQNVVGTFTFSLSPSVGTAAIGTKSVTDGAFNLSF